MSVNLRQDEYQKVTQILIQKINTKILTQFVSNYESIIFR